MTNALRILRVGEVMSPIVAGDPGVPRGTFELARRLGAALGDRLGCRVDLDWVERLLVLPFVTHRDPRRPDPPTQLADGALCVDLGPDDHDTWSSFRSVTRDDQDPESVAKRAQVWRLPISPYRRQRHSSPGWWTDVFDRGFTALGPTGLSGVTVVDFTSMWAGPLCTALLAATGATVVKIEPDCRLDGLRFGDGDDGRGLSPMFRALNGSKELASWDLRHCSHRSEFEQLVRSADLVVNSFSPRVLTNLGIAHDAMATLSPGIASLSITAFPEATPEADWVAYGSGVHAASGLAWDGETFEAPAFSYPDPLAGLVAAVVALDQLTGAQPPERRVSLLEAIAPLEPPEPGQLALSPVVKTEPGFEVRKLVGSGG